MKIHSVLLFCFYSALCSGNSGLASAKINIFTGPEGGDGTIECYFTLGGNMKFFCKDECKEEDILIKTDDATAINGKYSIGYRKESSDRGILSVTITNLKRSDSGRYRCGLGSSLVPDSYWDFEVRVSDELLDRNTGFITTHVEGETATFACNTYINNTGRFYFCRDQCKKEADILIETDQTRAHSSRYSTEYKEGSWYGLYVTIAQMTKSDTGQYQCGYGRALSPDSFRTFSLIVNAPLTTQLSSILEPLTTTATTTLTLTSSSESSTSSSVFPVTTTQLTATALNTLESNQTVYSVKTKKGLNFSLGSSAPSVFSDTTDPVTAFSSFPRTRYFSLLVVCVTFVCVLVLVLLFLYIWKTKKEDKNTELPVIYKKMDPVSTCEATSRD